MGNGRRLTTSTRVVATSTLCLDALFPPRSDPAAPSAYNIDTLAGRFGQSGREAAAERRRKSRFTAISRRSRGEDPRKLRSFRREHWKQGQGGGIQHNCNNHTGLARVLTTRFIHSLARADVQRGCPHCSAAELEKKLHHSSFPPTRSRPQPRRPPDLAAWSDKIQLPIITS